MVVRSFVRCTVTWKPNFLGWVDLLSYGAPPTRARSALRGAPLVILFGLWTLKSNRINRKLAKNLANQKHRQMFSWLCRIRTRYCALICRRSIQKGLECVLRRLVSHSGNKCDKSEKSSLQMMSADSWASFVCNNGKIVTKGIKDILSVSYKKSSWISLSLHPN